LTPKKHITLIGINYYPEDTAIGLYSTQLTEYLIENGFDVSVVTGFPYYPQWEIKQIYVDKPHFFQEKFGKIQILRYKQFVPENPTFLKRILHLLDFTYGSYRNLKNITHTDLVFSVIPFTTDVWLGNKLAKRHHAKLWVHIQDFEFDAAIESQLSSNKNFLFKGLFKIEAFLLNKAAVVSTISHSMIAKLKNKINNQPEIYLLPNWVDPEFINPAKTKLHPFLTSQKFKILYSGNIGQKQDWELYTKIVDYFKDTDDMEFMIVGAGAYKEQLKAIIKKYPNVKIYDPVPFEQLPDLLCSADLHVLFQKNDVIDTVMPSKILGMMASEKPSVIAGNEKSEVAKIINESNGGYYFDNNDFENIKKHILQLKKQTDIAQKIGYNARNYIIHHFSKEKVLSEFISKINSILEKQNVT